jgi:cytochrome b subunit of formate dehydrogenase
MMRTIEILIVIIIITGAFIAVSFYAVLPWPRQVSPVNLRRLSLTTLQVSESSKLRN